MHTPAPWTDDEAGFLGADGRPVGQPEKGKQILHEVARVEADRRLMREAPMLLTALRLIREDAGDASRRGLRVGDVAHFVNRIFDIANGAIAKTDAADR